ncbi:MAG: hypothetical protein ACREV8_02745 [Gammaproteobacteria bacterium]
MIPAEKRLGRAPAWPLSPMDEAEARLWKGMWAKPQAICWLEDDSVHFVALYTRLFARIARPNGMTSRAMVELRQLDKRLGVSPASMADMRWTIAPVPRAVPSEKDARVLQMKQRVRAVDEG